MKYFSIASWNVNSIRMRLDHLIDWILENSIDVICLQETKCEVEKFPHDALVEKGYYAICEGQKSYNGVAILAKENIQALPLTGYFLEHDQKRLIITHIHDYLLINIYVPNGQSVGSEKYIYKLEWLNELVKLIKSYQKDFSKIVICGDFNIAPEEKDHPEDVKDQIMISDDERKMFYKILSCGFEDALRLFNANEKIYTWWDYRIRAFQRNYGYRIDHFLVSESIKKLCKDCFIDKEPRKLEKPSDHAPIILKLER